MSTAPNASEQTISFQGIKFNKKESFEIEGNEKKYKLNISNNEKLMFFEIEEKNKFPKQDFNIYLSLDELIKINKFFLQFDNLNEISESLKELIKKNSLKIENEEKKIKIKIINPFNNKEFFINVPLKEKDIKAEINSIIPYIISLNEKIEELKKKVNDLEEKVNDNKKKINEIYSFKQEYGILKNKENNKENLMFKNSNIIKPEEQNLILNWFEKKPIKFNLLLDTKINGDSISTFSDKCMKKCPIIIFIKTTNGYRIGGFTSKFWPKSNYGNDDKSFLFSLDLKNKYKVIREDKAIYFCSEYFSFGNNLYIYNNCTMNSSNYINSPNSYDIPKKNKLLGGEDNFVVSNYEIYHVEY